MLNYALRLLSGREHSAAELLTKLVKKGVSPQDSEITLRECQRLGFQCDTRFADMVCRTRIRQGYGPLRIIQELKSKSIDQEIIDQILHASETNWVERITSVWQKKFEPSTINSVTDRQKQQRFLLYRGFAASDISSFFKENSIKRYDD